MSTVTAVPGVARYWRAVEDDPTREHTYAWLLGLHTSDPAELHALVGDGLTYTALERMQGVLDLPLRRVSDILHIPLRTLARRKEEGRLRADESDRLLRLARLAGRALRLFEGNLGATRTWLTTPQAALADAAPLDFATTEVGAYEVEHLIGRLEHGIPL